MRAIAITPGKPGARLIERPEPIVTAPDEVKMQVVRVGICGTDREELAGGRSQAPLGATELVIGHEMMGRVVEVGKAVHRVRAGDYAVFTVRRGCNACANCALGRADMCQTGNYSERGIQGLDGYQAEFALDREGNVVHVPPELEPVGVLLEPLSIVEKAIEEALQVQRRRDPVAAVTPDWLYGRRCLVAGLGPVGLLAALVFRLRGGEVFGTDVVDATSPRPKWLAAIGGKYINAKQTSPAQMAANFGGMDVVLDASGVASVEFNLLDALGFNGIYVLTGIPGGDRPLQVSGAELIRQMVLRNQVMCGSVNAARGHFQMAADDLSMAHLRWPGLVESLITHRRAPEAFVQEAVPPAGVIKEVVEWQGSASSSGVRG